MRDNMISGVTCSRGQTWYISRNQTTSVSKNKDQKPSYHIAVTTYTVKHTTSNTWKAKPSLFAVVPSFFDVDSVFQSGIFDMRT